MMQPFLKFYHFSGAESIDVMWLITSSLFNWYIMINIARRIWYNDIISLCYSWQPKKSLSLERNEKAIGQTYSYKNSVSQVSVLRTYNNGLISA